MSCKITLVIFMTWWTRSRWCSWGRSTAGGTWSRARWRTSSSRKRSHRPEAGELPGEPHRGHQIEHPPLLHLRELEARGMWRVVGPGCWQASRARWGALPPEGVDSCGTVTVLRGSGFDYVIVVNLIIFINKIIVKALLFFFWTDIKSHGDRVTTTTVNHGSGSLK